MKTKRRGTHVPVRRKNRPRFRIPRGILFPAIGMLAAIALLACVLPQFAPALLVPDSGPKQTVTMPLHQESSASEFTLNVTATMPPMHPALFKVTADDCLLWMTVNGKQVDDANNTCGDAGRVLDLRTFLHVGRNEIVARVHDDGGLAAFAMRPVARDPFILLLLILVVLGAAAPWILTRPWSIAPEWITAGVIGAGTLLRGAYAAVTPYWMRAYDWDGHVEYLRYVANAFQIPPAKEGWEFYQPPLYYFLGGGWMRIGENMGRSAAALIDDMQTLSLLLSIAALIAAAWLSNILFEKKSSEASNQFLALFAVFPGIVFFAPRISNDVLMLLLGCVWFGLLIEWWRSGSHRMWYASFVVLGMNLLVKSNALPLLGIAGICLLLRPKYSLRRRVSLGVRGLLIAAAISGWMFFRRFVLEKETFIVGNYLNGDMSVENSIRNFLSINPYRILALPYNDNWSDAFGRSHFWEYFFKSAFVGEWNFGLTLRPIVLALYCMALFLAVPALASLARDLWQRPRASLPYWLTIVMLLAASFAYRFASPFSANQDFRFVAPVFLPIAYYVIVGMLSLPARLAWLARCLGCSFCIFCAFFLFVLSYG